MRKKGFFLFDCFFITVLGANYEKKNQKTICVLFGNGTHAIDAHAECQSREI